MRSPRCARLLLLLLLLPPLLTPPAGDAAVITGWLPCPANWFGSWSRCCRTHWEDVTRLRTHITGLPEDPQEIELVKPLWVPLLHCKM
ncbi:hypothetical protein MJT46_016056 [Ovis ammon polii x Ovis aries]|nr:hypothetical protein MJT46_016056 [Ovis ammon polii x Ovis aries]